MSTQDPEVKAAAIKHLREVMKPGDTISTVLRHTSASGVTRRISVVTIPRKGETRQWDALVAEAIGEKAPGFDQGITMYGAGMDMGFDLVYRLSLALYGPRRKPRAGYPCLGDRCPSNQHVNDHTAPRGRGKGIRHTDGYALSQRWI